MFTRRACVALVLLVGMRVIYSVAQVHKGQSPEGRSQVAPLWARDKKVSKCELHGVHLKLDTVPIQYGIVGFPGGYYEASCRSFPHANLVVMGGCVVCADSPNRQTVKYCPQCRAAEKRWDQAQKKVVSKR